MYLWMKVVECSPITESLSSSNKMRGKNNSHEFKQQPNKWLGLMQSSDPQKETKEIATSKSSCTERKWLENILRILAVNFILARSVSQDEGGLYSQN